MTKIKLCGLTRPCDIETANLCKPDYIGFVLAEGSRRYVPPEKARALKEMLSPAIKAVGVFVREKPERVAELLNSGVLDIAQLHGGEDEAYLRRLRQLTDKPLFQAFRIDAEKDAERAGESSADGILLDSGEGGTGEMFDWSLLGRMNRPYFLAGGLSLKNVREAIRRLRPYGVDVSSGIESGGVKNHDMMAAFVTAVRKENKA